MGAQEAAEPYEVSAEFYDLLQADADGRAARRRYATAARAARVGVLDVGAGTGIVTELLLHESAAPVHAVEPSAAMRTGLLCRLARLGADERARVTVHPDSITDVGLRDAVDLVIAANVIACLSPDDRRAAWGAIALALRPGGLLLFETPPERVPDAPHEQRFGPARVGPDQYGAVARLLPDGDRMRVEFRYRVERDGELVREVRECFPLWPVGAGQLAEELTAAGLRPVDAADAVGAADARELSAARLPVR